MRLYKIFLLVVFLLVSPLHAQYEIKNDDLYGQWHLEVGWFGWDRNGKCWVDHGQGSFSKNSTTITGHDNQFFININEYAEMKISGTSIHIHENTGANLEWYGNLSSYEDNGFIKLKIEGVEYCNSMASMPFKLEKIVSRVDDTYKYENDRLKSLDEKLFDFTVELRKKYKVPSEYSSAKAAEHIWKESEGKLTNSEIAWLAIVLNPTGEGFSNTQKASILLNLPTDGHTNLIAGAQIGIDAWQSDEVQSILLMAGAGVGQGIKSALNGSIPAWNFYIGIIAKKGVKKPKMQHPEFKRAVDDVYKGLGKPDQIGTGSNADAIRREIITGLPTKDRYHTQKGKESINRFNKLKNKYYNTAPKSDIDKANKIIADTQDAIDTKW